MADDNAVDVVDGDDEDDDGNDDDGNDDEGNDEDDDGKKWKGKSTFAKIYSVLYVSFCIIYEMLYFLSLNVSMITIVSPN